MDRKFVVASVKHLIVVMTILWLVLFLLYLFVVGWDWGRSARSATVGGIPFYLIGSVYWAYRLSNSGADLSLPNPFGHIGKWVRGWSGWQRIIVLLSGAFSLCYSYWLMRDQLGFFGRSVLFTILFLVLSLASLFLLWLFSILFKWVVTGFNNSGKSDE